MEQAQFGDEANVGERDVVADQERTLRGECLLDARKVGDESLRHPGVKLGRDGAIAESQEVDLAVARKHQTGIKEAVDPRAFIGIVAIDWKALLAESG